MVKKREQEKKIKGIYQEEKSPGPSKRRNMYEGTFEELTMDSSRPALLGDSWMLTIPSMVSVMPSCRVSDRLSTTTTPLTVSCTQQRLALTHFKVITTSVLKYNDKNLRLIR